jgi:hypothetical protein
MSLLNDAAEDWQEIMNDDTGAAWPCTVTDPDGNTQPFYCRMSDTSQQIDPSTNTVVSGRRVVFSISLIDLQTKGMLDIKGVESNSKKPWKIDTTDILDRTQNFKVVETNPDASIGNMVIYAELIK